MTFLKKVTRLSCAGLGAIIFSTLSLTGCGGDDSIVEPTPVTSDTRSSSVKFRAYSSSTDRGQAIIGKDSCSMTMVSACVTQLRCFRGILVGVFDAVSGDILLRRNPDSLFDYGNCFDTYAWATATGEDWKEFTKFLNGIPTGALVLVAVADEAGLTEGRNGDVQTRGCEPLKFTWVEQGRQALEALGSTMIRDYCYWDSWAMISIKGEGVKQEQLQRGTRGSVDITYTLTLK